MKKQCIYLFLFFVIISCNKDELQKPFIDQFLGTYQGSWYETPTLKCGYADGNVIVSKKDSLITIIGRKFDCGSWITFPELGYYEKYGNVPDGVQFYLKNKTDGILYANIGPEYGNANDQTIRLLFNFQFTDNTGKNYELKMDRIIPKSN